VNLLLGKLDIVVRFAPEAGSSAIIRRQAFFHSSKAEVLRHEARIGARLRCGSRWKPERLNETHNGVGDTAEKSFHALWDAAVAFGWPKHALAEEAASGRLACPYSKVGRAENRYIFR
jgi:hypothetical protein